MDDWIVPPPPPPPPREERRRSAHLAATDEIFNEAERAERDGEVDADQRALVLYQKALDAYREAGEDLDAAWTLNNMGWVYLRTDQAHEAAAVLRESIALFERTGHRIGEATAREGLAAALGADGDLRGARAMLEGALELLERETYVDVNIADVLASLGDVYSELGELVLARDAYARAAEIDREYEREKEVDVLESLARTYDQLREPALAQDCRQRVLDLHLEGGKLH